MSTVDMKLETVVIPVSDVDRAKEFYEASGGGWTPTSATTTSGSSSSRRPGSGCSIQFGTGLTSAAPGSAAEPPRRLRHRGGARRRSPRDGVDASEVFHDEPSGGYNRWRPGRSGERSRSRAAHATRRSSEFSDPDGNALAAAGDHEPAAGSRRPGDDDVQLRRRSRERAQAGRPPPTASTRSAPARPMRTGPSGTPRTWWRSRPATSSRRDRLRRHRPRRRRARRALRRRAGRGRPARRRRRARARRRRVLLLGVHPVEDAAAPG